MCEVKEYVNIQNGEKLNKELLHNLKDNALLKVNPSLWIEWDFKKNDELGLDIWKVTKGSEKKVWWLCDEGHNTFVNSNSKANGTSCAYCTNVKTLVGYNDMWTTNPELAKLLHNPEDGYKYTQQSSKKVNWECPDCDEIINNKRINNIERLGLRCPNCSDSMKFPEKIMYNTLKSIKDDFENQKAFIWSKSKVYDFYIPTLNMIIETHGIQHYEQSNRGRSLKKEQANDNYKHELAIQNGIKLENYIVIDCRESDFEFIKNNIMNSRLAEVFDLSNVDWCTLEIKSQKSVYIEFLDLWNDGLSLKEISNITKMSRDTISTVLRNFDKLGKCKYDKNRGRVKSRDNAKIVCQFDTEMNFIKEFATLDDAKKDTGVSQAMISLCCNGKYPSTRGFIFKYKTNGSNKYNTNTPIVQLTRTGELIKEWSSIKEASVKLDTKPYNITKVCRGESLSLYGFKWMYKEDYEKSINGL